MALLLYTKSAEPEFEEVRVFRPAVFHHQLKGERLKWKERAVRMYFCMLSREFCIYYVRDCAGSIVHTSFVMPGCRKFPFLQEGEYVIGPCVTKEESRGKGIYGKVLEYIVRCHRVGGGNTISLPVTAIMLPLPG